MEIFEFRNIGRSTCGCSKFWPPPGPERVLLFFFFIIFFVDAHSSLGSIYAAGVTSVAELRNSMSLTIRSLCVLKVKFSGFFFTFLTFEIIRPFKKIFEGFLKFLRNRFLISFIFIKNQENKKKSFWFRSTLEYRKKHRKNFNIKFLHLSPFPGHWCKNFELCW